MPLKKKRLALTLGWFISILAVNGTLSISISIGAAYYAGFAIALLISFICSGLIIKADRTFMMFYAFCILSIISNDIPEFFSPWGRLISFIMATLVLSPALRTQFLFYFRAYSFKSALFLLQFVVIGSLIFFLAGINVDSHVFDGITTHSMLLSPISAIVIIYCTYNIYPVSSLMKKRKKIILIPFYIFLFIASFVCMLLAGSRIALLGCVIGLIAFFTVVLRFKIKQFIKPILTFIAILICTYSLWNPYLEAIENKNRYAIEHGSNIMESRTALWQKRIDEFKTSPVTGIGFAAVRINTLDLSDYDEESGHVEPGNSWLSILSMTGILGFIAFCGIIYQSCRKLRKIYRSDVRLTALLASLLCFYSVHMMAEGYVFGAGGFMFFFFWLIIGTIDSIYNNQNICRKGD